MPHEKILAAVAAMLMLVGCKEEPEEPELEYEGSYTKYPKREPARGSYHSLVEIPGVDGGGGTF